MSALYGRLRSYTKDGSRSGAESTRTAGGAIEARLETWTGAVSVVLEADGAYRVETGKKHGPGEGVHEGRVS